MDHRASLDAHFLAAESYYLVHDEPRALEPIEAIEASAERTIDRAPARNLKATILTNQGRPQEATAISVQTLALLGVQLPDTLDQAALGAAISDAFGAYQGALGAWNVTTPYDSPPMKDPEKFGSGQHIGLRDSVDIPVEPRSARAVEQLLLEPVRTSLERLGKYACALAARLGKAEPGWRSSTAGCSSKAGARRRTRSCRSARASRTAKR